MNFFSEKLIKSEELEKRLRTICSFNSAKCEIVQGRIFYLKDTNISFIEPHKVFISTKTKKLLLLYFNRDNLFLYDRTMPITIKKLDLLLKYINGKVK